MKLSRGVFAVLVAVTVGVACAPFIGEATKGDPWIVNCGEWKCMAGYECSSFGCVETWRAGASRDAGSDAR